MKARRIAEASNVKLDCSIAIVGGSRMSPQPKYVVGNTCYVVGRYKDGDGGLVNRTFRICSVERVGNTFEYSLKDVDEPSYRVTGVPEDKIR